MFKQVTKFLSDVARYPKQALLTREVNKRTAKLLADYEQTATSEIAKEIPSVDGIDGRLLVLLNLKQIDCPRLAAQLVEEWDNIHLHQFVEDLFDVLLSYGELSKQPQQAYRYYLHINNVLGTGAQGIVSAGVFGSCDSPIFAEKNTTSKDESDLLREFVVGRELSTLKNPVFTHIYTLFPCSNVLAVDKEVISFCQTGGQYSIGFQLLKGKTLKDTPLTAEQFEIVFIILLSALYDATRLEFTHHDLHDENVFIRKLEEPLLVPINVPGLDIAFVKTDYFPFILDYGLARINTKYGALLPDGFQEFGIRDEYVPMHDLYKLLFFTLRDQPNLGIEYLMSSFEPNLTPVNSKNFIKALNKRNEFFVVPEGLRDMSIEDYVLTICDHLEKHAYNGSMSDFDVVGVYEEKDFFQEYNLLNKTPSQSDMTDKVLIDFNMPLVGNSKVSSSSYVMHYSGVLKEFFDELERYTPMLDTMSSKEFELHYFKITDLYCNVFDGIQRYVERINYDKKTRDAATYEKRVRIYGHKQAQEEPFNALGADGFELVNREDLVNAFNNAGRMLDPWDRKLIKLIKAKKIPDVKASIFKIREIQF